jgi:hypothetical protein
MNRESGQKNPEGDKEMAEILEQMYDEAQKILVEAVALKDSQRAKNAALQMFRLARQILHLDEKIFYRLGLSEQDMMDILNQDAKDLTQGKLISDLDKES